MEENKYYVYLHIKEDTGEPFYVGKGKDNRYKVKSGRNQYWKNIDNKYGYDIIFLEENLYNEDACLREMYWIKRIGRLDLNLGPLINFTDGGETTKGFKHSEESKKQMSISRIGLPTSNLQKETVGNRYKNKFGKEHNRSKSIICITNGETYESISDASRKLNIIVSSISQAIKANRPTKGMHFQFDKF